MMYHHIRTFELNPCVGLFPCRIGELGGAVGVQAERESRYPYQRDKVHFY